MSPKDAFGSPRPIRVTGFGGGDQNNQFRSVAKQARSSPTMTTRPAPPTTPPPKPSSRPAARPRPMGPRPPRQSRAHPAKPLPGLVLPGQRLGQRPPTQPRPAAQPQPRSRPRTVTRAARRSCRVPRSDPHRIRVPEGVRSGCPIACSGFRVTSLSPGHAAIALRLAAAHAREPERAVLADRERIAHDLHDHVIQRLFAAGMDLQGSIARAGSVGHKGSQPCRASVMAGPLIVCERTRDTRVRRALRLRGWKVQPARRRPGGAGSARSGP